MWNFNLGLINTRSRNKGNESNEYHMIYQEMLSCGANTNLDGEHENKFKDDDSSPFYGREMYFFRCPISLKGTVTRNLPNN